MVNVLADPVHEMPAKVKVGVTTIVPVMGAFVMFVAINDISLLPVPGRPIFVLLFVQEYVVVPMVLVVPKVTDVLVPLHTIWLAGWFTCPAGFTVTTTSVGVPLQVSITGVM